ncbi:MAG TPA: Clp protease N-terminal domain-containing protein [Solirubrobacteraceae bacterium]
MFEKFTERARQVVVLAQEEARALKHNYIGTEHLLLGLLREEDGVAARVLQSLEITVERVRASVVRMVGPGEELTEGQVPFTPRAKKVLELALRESLILGHNYIGTEHILLGLVRENEGVAARILLDFDADAERIRNEVIRMVPGPEPPGSRQVTMSSGRPTRRPLDVAWLDGLGAALDRLALEIRGQLAREPDAGDLLLALACAPDTLPAQALGELGVDLDALWGTIERIRQRAARAREQLTQQISEVRAGKEHALEAQDFERAAALRDQERELLELAQARTVIEPELLEEIRRRLGIPRTDEPPPAQPARGGQ